MTYARTPYSTIEPTLHLSVLQLTGYPTVGSTAGLVFNVTYSAAAAAAATPLDDPQPVRLDVTGSEYAHMYRVYDIVSNIGTGDPSTFAPYDHASETTAAVDGTTYTVKARFEVLAAGVIPVYVVGMDGDIVTAYVAASDDVSMPYEAYALTGQTYLDGIADGEGRSGAGAGAVGAQLQGQQGAVGAQLQGQQGAVGAGAGAQPHLPHARHPQLPGPPPSLLEESYIRIAPAGMPSAEPGARALEIVAAATADGEPATKAPPELESPRGGGGASQTFSSHTPYIDVHGTVRSEGYYTKDLIPVHGIQVCVYDYHNDDKGIYPMYTAGSERACAFTDDNGMYRISRIMNIDHNDTATGADLVTIAYTRGPDDLEVIYYESSTDRYPFYRGITWPPHTDADGDVEHNIVMDSNASGAARALSAMSDARAFFDDYGLPREPLYVLWQHDAGASALPGSVTNGAKTWRNVIWLDGNSPSTRDNTHQRRTMLHEFAHYAAYIGGVLNDYSCSLHYIDRKNTPGCAWGEGWAGVAPHIIDDEVTTRRTMYIAYDMEAGVVRSAITGSVFYPFDTVEPPSRYIGDRVEGRVAAALWDMADSEVDPVYDASRVDPLAYDDMAAGYGPIVDMVLAGTWNTTGEFYDAWEDRHYDMSAESVMRLHGMAFAIPNDVKYYVPAGSFGGNGSGRGQMHYPLDVDVAPDGTVLVADTANNRVQAFDANGTFLRQFGPNTTDGGSLRLPSAVAANRTHAFVADSLNARVAVFSASDGSYAGSIRGDGAGGRFGMPAGLAANSTHLLVADSANLTITALWDNGTANYTSALRLDPATPGYFTSKRLDASLADLDRGLALYGLNGSGLMISNRLAIAPDGTAAATDFTDPRLRLVGPGGPQHGAVSEVLHPKQGHLLLRLSDVDFDPLGRTVSSEWTGGLIRVIGTDGVFVEEFGGTGRGAGEFYHLAGVAVGDTGRIYAADAANNRVQMFDFDVDPPRVDMVRARAPNGTAAAAPETVYIAVSFTEPVTVDTAGGIPILVLNAGAEGGRGASAVYFSGSGSTTLTFEYEIGASDSAARLGYLSAGSLDPNGASIADGSGNAADLGLAEPGSIGSLSSSSDVGIVATVQGDPAVAQGPDPEALYERCLMHYLLCRY